MSRPGSFAGVAFVLLVAVGGCAPRPSVPPVYPQVEDAAEVLERQRAGTQTLRAVFSFEARGPKHRESGRGALVIARPDRLRLQLFSLGFLTVYDYTADGVRWRLRRPLEGISRTGRFDDGAGLAAGEPWNLRPLFLRDEAPITESEPLADGARRVRLESGRELVVSLRRGVVLEETIVSEDGAVLHARYSEFDSVDGLPLPFRIQVEVPARDTSLSIEIEEYRRNVAIEDRLFGF